MFEAIKIKLTDCKHGYLYRIESRNLQLGVFNQANNGFVGIRNKFGHRYLFTEFHYDTGAPFGTVNPVELLNLCPHKLDEESQILFDWLDEKLKTYGLI